MKTKTSLVAALGGLALLFSGCLVISVYPYYNEKDLTFEPGLLGSWTKISDQPEHWKFEKSDANGYQLTVSDNSSTKVMQAHVFKLHGQSFLDLYAPDASTDVQPPPIPSHLLLRVVTLSPNAKLAALDHGWLRDLLSTNPKSLRHEVPKTKDKPEDRPIVLTADTAELQAFVIKYLETKEAWTEPIELKHD